MLFRFVLCTCGFWEYNEEIIKMLTEIMEFILHDIQASISPYFFWRRFYAYWMLVQQNVSGKELLWIRVIFAKNEMKCGNKIKKFKFQKF